MLTPTQHICAQSNSTLCSSCKQCLVCSIGWTNCFCWYPLQGRKLIYSWFHMQMARNSHLLKIHNLVWKSSRVFFFFDIKKTTCVWYVLVTVPMSNDRPLWYICFSCSCSHAGAISSAQAMVKYHGSKNISVESLTGISSTDEPKRTTQNSTGFTACTLRMLFFCFHKIKINKLFNNPFLKLFLTQG